MVCSFCMKNKQRDLPPFAWTCRQALEVLQHYPTGVTKAVLITELEVKWRQAVRRGEHTGKLGQVLSLLQLELSDVISGFLIPVDEFRARLISPDDTNIEIDMIMHRQISDFVAFSKFNKFDVRSNRMFSFTHGRLLKGKPLMLLPTPIISFTLNVSPSVISGSSTSAIAKHQQEDRQFIDTVLTPLHAHSYTALINATTTSQVEQANERITVVFARITQVGSIFPHPANSSIQVRIVRLQIQMQKQEATRTASAEAEAKNSSRTVYLILFDEQISLVRLWEIGDLLLIYRPYVGLNATEQLFGSRTRGVSTHGLYGISHDIVQRATIDLDGVIDDPWTAPVHFFYGGITVCCIVNEGAATATATALATSTSISSNAPSGSGMRKQLQNVSQQQQLPDFLSMCRPDVATEISMLGRVLAIHGPIASANAGTGSGLIDDEEQCGMWVQPVLPYSSSSQEKNNVGNVAHNIKVPAAAALVHIACSNQTLQILRSRKHIQEGHLLYIDNLWHDPEYCRVSNEDSDVVCASAVLRDMCTATASAIGADGRGWGLDWMKFAHILPLKMLLTTSVGTSTASSATNAGSGNGRRDNTTTAVAAEFGGEGGATEAESKGDTSFCVINVSHLTTLVNSPSILPPLSLVCLLEQLSGTGTATGTATATADSVWIQSTCISCSGCSVVVAHVINATVDGHMGLVLTLCSGNGNDSDGRDSACVRVHVGVWTVNLTTALIPSADDVINSTGNGSGNGNASASGICSSWMGKQFTFLLSRSDDCSLASISIPISTQATSSNGNGSQNGSALAPVSASVPIIFAVNSVADVEPCAVAWSLLRNIRQKKKHRLEQRREKAKRSKPEHEQEQKQDTGDQKRQVREGQSLCQVWNFK